MGFWNKLKFNFKHLNSFILNHLLSYMTMTIIFNNYLFSRCPNFSQNTYIMLLTTILGEGINTHPMKKFVDSHCCRRTSQALQGFSFLNLCHQFAYWGYQCMPYDVCPNEFPVSACSCVIPMHPALTHKTHSRKTPSISAPYHITRKVSSQIWSMLFF